MSPLFTDRAAAGRALAGLLGAYAGRPDAVVLALPPGGVPVAREVALALGVPLDLLIAAGEIEEIRLRALYCGMRQRVPLAGQIAIVVDDGILTGQSMRNALKALRAAGPEWIVVAVPVAPVQAHDLIGTGVDEFICIEQPPDLERVGACYRDFRVPTDEEVRRLIA